MVQLQSVVVFDLKSFIVITHTGGLGLMTVLMLVMLTEEENLKWNRKGPDRARSVSTYNLLLPGIVCLKRVIFPLNVVFI